nr:helix-turn-helix domain-containing protein [Comamonas jiangduensis]
MQHILDAALAEFSRQGYNAARMEDIARSAGLSKGGLYAHFPSKESLLQQLLARVLEAPLLENLHWWPCEARTLEDLVDAFVDHTLQRLAARLFCRPFACSWLRLHAFPKACRIGTRT